MTQITLPQWYDLHVHLRQGAAMEAYVKAQIAMGCAGILAMPNTKPPIAKVFDSSPGDAWSIESYLAMIRRAGGDKFTQIIVPLYLTAGTTPQMIETGAAAGILKACKYYPPHGTTNAESGAPLETYMENGVFKAVEKAGIVLCIHGEEHGLSADKYFNRDTNAEDIFYKTRMPKLVKKFPKLKIVCEHVTTKTAVDFVKKAKKNVAATVTPQHLLYTVSDLVKGFRYHLYCLPLVKFDKDREALRKAVTDAKNTKFFAGTDSAPHAKKFTDCGCAAGCFTGGIAPQLYAEAFELSGLDLSSEKTQNIFRQFLCENGAKFYGLPIPEKTFTLQKKEQSLAPVKTADGEVIPLPLGLERKTIPWSIR
jgi:dihydroorotase